MGTLKDDLLGKFGFEDRTLPVQYRPVRYGKALAYLSFLCGSFYCTTGSVLLCSALSGLLVGLLLHLFNKGGPSKSAIEGYYILSSVALRLTLIALLAVIAYSGPISLRPYASAACATVTFFGLRGVIGGHSK